MSERMWWYAKDWDVVSCCEQYKLGSIDTYQNGRPAAGHIGAGLILLEDELQVRCEIG